MSVFKGYARKTKFEGQTFERMLPQYFVNDKGFLEESPILRDTQAVIDSAEYTQLDAIYDRMLDLMSVKFNNIVEGEDIVHEREAHETKLDALLELDRIREEYSQYDPAVASMSHAELAKHIKGKIDDSNKKIKEHIDKRKEKENNAPNPPQPKGE